MTFEQLLYEVRARRLILTYSRTGRVVPWSPGQGVPRHVRSAIARHNAALQMLIARSDINTCPNPDLHRQSWSYQVCRYCCDVCARLRPWCA